MATAAKSHRQRVRMRKGEDSGLVRKEGGSLSNYRNPPRLHVRRVCVLEPVRFSALLHLPSSVAPQFKLWQQFKCWAFVKPYVVQIRLYQTCKFVVKKYICRVWRPEVYSASVMPIVAPWSLPVRVSRPIARLLSSEVVMPQLSKMHLPPMHAHFTVGWPQTISDHVKPGR